MHVNQTDSLVISCQIIFHDDVAANSTFHFDLESRLSLYQGFCILFVEIKLRGCVCVWLVARVCRSVKFA